MSVRVRFAPSPTGYLHVGGARTALFNWLYARHHGGKFILRIEDTDRERSTKESEQEILDSMKWLGLDWDEGPVYQSTRLSSYREQAQRLLEKGLAYRAKNPKEAPPSPPPQAGGKGGGDGEAIIARMPSSRKIAWDDMIYGHIEFDSQELKDQVLLKSDGMPAYNFACVVDDADMRIDPVIRGEDHLSNTPKQIVLYEALGLKPPRFAHVPLILGPDYSRLSKRHGATSVGNYREAGYLAKAMVNYLVLLGWSSGTQQELFGLEELVRLFDLDKVSRKGAVFAAEKLQWMNAHYIKQLSEEELTQAVMPYLVASGLVKPGAADDRVRAVVHLLKDRLKLLRDITDFGACFFQEDIVLDEAAAKKFLVLKENGPMLERVIDVLKLVEPFDPATIEKPVRGVIEEFKVKSTPLIQMLRVALTGKSVGAGLFETMSVLGKPVCLERLAKAKMMLAS